MNTQVDFRYRALRGSICGVRDYADTVVYGTIRTAEAADYVEGVDAVPLRVRLQLS